MRFGMGYFEADTKGQGGRRATTTVMPTHKRQGLKIRAWILNQMHIVSSDIRCKLPSSLLVHCIHLSPRYSTDNFSIRLPVR